MVRIALSGETRNGLAARLRQADANHATRLIRRVHALLELAGGEAVSDVAQLLAVGERTVRDWLHAFVLSSPDSLSYRSPRGRPPKLTACQRQELRVILVAEPEEAGDTSACWTAGMIADLIRLRFKVNFAPRYVCYLLDRLGFSYQKGKFTADH